MMGSGMMAVAGDFEQSVTQQANKPMRELSADRPDSTESPITVDEGHWQVETSVVDYVKDFGFEAWTWGETNLKYGITDNADLQFVFAPYAEEKSGGQKVDGASDLTIRLKYNVWGNDGGKTALAIFPYVKVPTDTDLSNEKWEGGLILPFSIDLTEDWGLGLQSEFEYAWDDNDSDYDLEWLHTAVLGTSLTDRVGVYVEYLGIAGDHPYQAHLSGGVTYAVNELIQLDVGSVVGLNDAAEDLNVFSGFTVKF